MLISPRPFPLPPNPTPQDLVATTALYLTRSNSYHTHGEATPHRRSENRALSRSKATT